MAAQRCAWPMLRSGADESCKLVIEILSEWSQLRDMSFAVCLSLARVSQPGRLALAVRRSAYGLLLNAQDWLADQRLSG